MRLLEGPLVDPLRDAAVEFSLAHMSLDRAAKSSPLIDHALCTKTHELAENVDATIEIVRLLRDWAMELHRSQTETDGVAEMMNRWTAGNHLALGFKIMYLWVRAYQDAIYQCLLVAQRQPGGRGSMASALRGNSPLNGLLRREIPDYLPWFESWRSVRNALKDGASFEVLPDDQGDVALIPVRHSADGSFTFGPHKGALKGNDLVQAIVMCTLVTKLVSDKLAEA